MKNKLNYSRDCRLETLPMSRNILEDFELYRKVNNKQE
jgi:hypothetical protein